MGEEGQQGKLRLHSPSCSGVILKDRKGGAGAAGQDQKRGCTFTRSVARSEPREAPLFTFRGPGECVGRMGRLCCGNDCDVEVIVDRHL